MLEGKRVSVIGAIFVVLGAIVLFLSWILFGSVGSCGDPWPGCRSVPFNWHVGLVGMILVTTGLGLFGLSAHRKMKTDKNEMPAFISIMVTFTLFIIITVTVYNPFISPYDFIRDSDGDGYTDDIDSFPKDKDRHMPTSLEIGITWENTTTNYSARVTSVYFYLDGEPTDTSVMRLVIQWLPEYSQSYSEDIGTLKDIEGVWKDGVMFEDNAPLGLFGLDDVFFFDIDIFDAQADAYILDDLGYYVADFQITA